MATIQRPGPLRWLWFSFGGRLPDRYREWVLHDATAKTWRWRYAARLVVRTSPFLLAGYFVLRLLPVPAWSIFVALGGALCYVLFILVASGDEMRKTRLAQHGYPPDAHRARQEPGPRGNRRAA